MSPDERRASILAAAVPLLLERGTDVTTRELAAAAGVAEGTLFRVFPDKQAIVRAAIDQLLDPAPLLAQFESLIDAAADSSLRAVLVRAVEALQVRAQAIVSIFVVAHQVLENGDLRPGARHARSPHRGDGQYPMDPVTDAVTTLFAAHADELRHPAPYCAQLLTALVFATVHPGVARTATPLTPEDIVDVMLDGLRHRTKEN
jgi:AcrR family transcriptional regulator